MYKYQEKIIDGIDDAVYKIERMTEEHYELQIGWRHTNDFEKSSIPIFVEINGNSRFTQETLGDEFYGCKSKCEIGNYNRIELNEEIFLDLNKIIDKVLKENKKREEFYEKLGANLEAFNKTLDEMEVNYVLGNKT